MHSHVTLPTGESEFAIFNILDINFLALNRSCHYKNKPVLSQGSYSFLIIFLGHLEEFRRIRQYSVILDNILVGIKLLEATNIQKKNRHHFIQRSTQIDPFLQILGKYRR